MTVLKPETQQLLADFRDAKGGTSRQYRRRMQVYDLLITACVAGMFVALSSNGKLWGLLHRAGHRGSWRMNGLTLIIVNDGNGDQCGATYHDRLRVARMSQLAKRERSWWLMVERAEAWHRAHDGEPHNIAYERQAVAELDHYYQQHIKEL